MQTLTVYNKETIEGQYPNGLAYSVHISVQGEPIRNDYGMLFPKGNVDEENRIVPVFTGAIRIASVVIGQKNAYLITGENWDKDGAVVNQHVF